MEINANECTIYKGIVCDSDDTKGKEEDVEKQCFYTIKSGLFIHGSHTTEFEFLQVNMLMKSQIK